MFWFVSFAPACVFIKRFTSFCLYSSLKVPLKRKPVPSSSRHEALSSFSFGHARTEERGVFWLPAHPQSRGARKLPVPRWDPRYNMDTAYKKLSNQAEEAPSPPAGMGSPRLSHQRLRRSFSANSSNNGNEISSVVSSVNPGILFNPPPHPLSLSLCLSLSLPQFSHLLSTCPLPQFACHHLRTI